MGAIAHLRLVCTTVAGSAGAWTFTLAGGATLSTKDGGKAHAPTGTLTVTSSLQAQEMKKGDVFKALIYPENEQPAPLAD